MPTRCSIKTCHRRGIHAIGGMAAQIPIKVRSPEANEKAIGKVRADKEREAATATTAPGWPTPAWCRSPLEVFDAHMPGQSDRQTCARTSHVDGRRSAVRVPGGRDHRGGPAAQHRRRHPVSRGLAAGNGCVPLYHLMEDAATAEISRTQVWQWIHHGGEARRTAARSTAELCRDC